MDLCIKFRKMKKKRGKIATLFYILGDISVSIENFFLALHIFPFSNSFNIFLDTKKIIFFFSIISNVRFVECVAFNVMFHFLFHFLSSSYFSLLLLIILYIQQLNWEYIHLWCSDRENINVHCSICYTCIIRIHETNSVLYILNTIIFVYTFQY